MKDFGSPVLKASRKWRLRIDSSYCKGDIGFQQGVSAQRKVNEDQKSLNDYRT